MQEKGHYDRSKFVDQARTAEKQRLDKEEEWNKKNEAWVKEHGPMPFEVPKLLFDGK